MTQKSSALVGKKVEELLESYRGYTLQLEKRSRYHDRVSTVFVGENINTLMKKMKETNDTPYLAFYVTLWVDGFKSETAHISDEFTVIEIDYYEE